MPVFVYLAEARAIDKIKRSGIRPTAIHSEDYSLGVFCMPVINDKALTQLSHSESRSLAFKNVGKRSIN